MTERRNVNQIRIARMDEYRADLLCVAQAKVFPGFAAVNRLIHAVAGGKIRTLKSFTAADVDRVGT